MLGSNEEKSLKRWLKRKISINKGVLIAFLISGLFFPVSSFSDGAPGRLNNPGSGHKSAVAIGGLDNGKAVANGSNSVALGANAKADGTDTVAIGQGHMQKIKMEQ